MTGSLVPLDPPERKAFAAIFNRLCVAVREPADESGITLRTYWDALKDVPVRALEDGAVALMREPGRKWLPSVGEWRAAALAASETALRDAVKPARDEPWHDECEACQDTGFQFDRRCPGNGECGIKGCVKMARGGRSSAHTYATPCSCRPMNRTYQRSIVKPQG